MRLGRWLQIDHRFRDRQTDQIWTVRQVHRADCTAELVCPSCGHRHVLTFADLRERFRWIAS